jgi:hypothetical protein
VRMLGKCSRGRLRKLFTGPDDGKLDYRTTGIWEHLHSCKSTLKITVEWKPLPNCKNDVVMMEALTETEEFTATELKEIKPCRIYLRVFYISDIASHDEQGIADWTRKVRRDSGKK